MQRVTLCAYANSSCEAQYSMHIVGVHFSSIAFSVNFNCVKWFFFFDYASSNDANFANLSNWHIRNFIVFIYSNCNHSIFLRAFNVIACDIFSSSGNATDCVSICGFKSKYIYAYCRTQFEYFDTFQFQVHNQDNHFHYYTYIDRYTYAIITHCISQFILADAFSCIRHYCDAHWNELIDIVYSCSIDCNLI